MKTKRARKRARKREPVVANIDNSDVCRRLSAIARTARTLADEIEAVANAIRSQTKTLSPAKVHGKSVGDRIRNARIAAGFNQRDFALRVGMVPSQLSKIEKSYMGMTVATAMRVARALGVTVGELLEGRKHTTGENKKHE